MVSISELSNAQLLKILSLLPARDAVATMFLSKRWQRLWMMVPRLVYDDSYQNLEYGSFSRFVDRSLFLHEAPVIEKLHFKLGQKCGAVDIGVWIRTAVKRVVRKLIFEKKCSSASSPVIVPRSLYTGFSILVSLKLSKVTLVDVTTPISFPSLKKLSLLSVKYPGDEFVQRMLSSCPVLESLYVEQCPNDNVTIFTVRVPSLKHLSVCKSLEKYRDNADGFVIDAPSLEFLEILDDTGGFCVIENDMPNIVDADVDVTLSHPGKILSCITSVKSLYLCLPTTAEDAYPVGIVFPNLVDLTLCRRDVQWLNLLMRVLGDSPKLRALKLDQYYGFHAHQPSPCWIEPSSVPECLSSSLETLEFVDYEGTEVEKEVVAFILRNSKCLKKATISSNSTYAADKKLMMLKELASSPRRSVTCQLIFD